MVISQEILKIYIICCWYQLKITNTRIQQRHLPAPGANEFTWLGKQDHSHDSGTLIRFWTHKRQLWAIAHPHKQAMGACDECFWDEIDGILPKGPYPPCLRMADRALLAGYHRNVSGISGLGGNGNPCNTRILIKLCGICGLNWDLIWMGYVLNHSWMITRIKLGLSRFCCPTSSIRLQWGAGYNVKLFRKS